MPDSELLINVVSKAAGRERETDETCSVSVIQTFQYCEKITPIVFMSLFSSSLLASALLWFVYVYACLRNRILWNTRPRRYPQREVDPASVVTCFCFRVAHVRGLISCIDAVILCFRYRDEDPDLAWWHSVWYEPTAASYCKSQLASRALTLTHSVTSGR